MVLLHPGERPAAQISSQDRDGVARGAARRDALLFPAGRAEKEPPQAVGTREEGRDAIFPEERHSLRGDGRRRNRGIGEERGREGRQFGGPGAEVRGVLEPGTIGVASGCRSCD
jgi:hypothetical protein